MDVEEDNSLKSNQDRNERLEFWITIILLIATLVTIIVEVAFSNTQTTRLETSLFSILQFLFAVSFSWLFSRMSLRADERDIEDEETIRSLLSSLPSSLKLALRYDTFEQGQQQLSLEKTGQGYVSLKGFYDSSFEEDIYNRVV